MPSQNIYLLAALPALEDLGSAPPLSLVALRQHLGDSRASELVEAVLLADDLLQRDAFIAGEDQSVAPSVLSDEQVRGKEPLPEFLDIEAEADGSPRLSTDLLRQRYYRYAAELARSRRSELLSAWTRFEVSLRNSLATNRARALGLDAAPYLVVPELAEADPDTETIVQQCRASTDPFASERALDAARYQWLDEHEPYYCFTNDELVAYALRLLLLTRWQRLTKRVDSDDRALWKPYSPSLKGSDSSGSAAKGSLQ